MSDRIARELRRRILLQRLTVAEAKRDNIAARLRLLKARESKRITAAVRESLRDFERSTRTAG